MSKLIKDSTLLEIANAIRNKTETADPIKVKDFASVIANMETSSNEGVYCWAKSAQKNELPFGYTKVKNLVSTGTQLIDTEIVPTGNTKVHTTVNYNHTGTGYLFGCLNSWVNGAYGLIYYGTASNNMVCLYGTAGTSVAIPRGVENEVEMSGSGVKVNGSQALTYATANIAASYSMYLFGRHTSASAITETMTGTIGDTEIYQDGSTLSKNLLCCLDADGTPCMYDTVTGKNHYNIGTGTFGAGETEYVSNALGYAVSDDINAYPNDGYADDGYYYERIDAGR